MLKNNCPSDSPGWEANNILHHGESASGDRYEQSAPADPFAKIKEMQQKYKMVVNSPKITYSADPIVERVLNRIKDRADVGMVKFGHSMAQDKRKTEAWINDATEELLDAALYLTRLKEDMLVKSFTFNDYSKIAHKTAVYPVVAVVEHGTYPIQEIAAYAALGLCGEAGEVAENFKKAIRDDGGEITAKRRQKILLELGDVLWYLNECAISIGSSLEEVARANNDKLQKRAEQDRLKGEGSAR